jgi:hypothetical protein
MPARLFGGESARGEVAGEQRGDGGEDQKRQRVEQAGAEAQGQDHGQAGEDGEEGEAAEAADAFEQRGEFVEADLEGVHGWLSARWQRFPPNLLLLLRPRDGGSGTAVRDEAPASLGSMKMPDSRTFGISGLWVFSREP